MNLFCSLKYILFCCILCCCATSQFYSMNSIQQHSRYKCQGLCYASILCVDKILCLCFLSQCRENDIFGDWILRHLPSFKTILDPSITKKFHLLKYWQWKPQRLFKEVSSISCFLFKIDSSMKNKESQVIIFKYIYRVCTKSIYYELM